MKLVIGSALAAFSTLCSVNAAYAYDTKGAAPPVTTTVVVAEAVPPTTVAPPITPQESYSNESYSGLMYVEPLIGADLSSLMWRDDNRGEGSVAMTERGLSTFIYGGLGGRFDIGGDRVDEWMTTLARR